MTTTLNNGKFIIISYDATGNVVSVDYSNNGGTSSTTYYYVRNAQGDIIGLVNSSGKRVVTYEYDTWGKLLSITGSLPNSLGTLNPFRYRGYAYDTETGWYYLQSRYYDPELGRFISSDVYLSTGQGIIGHNAYAYCLNNPVKKKDSNGKVPYNVLETGSATIGGCYDVNTNDNIWTRIGDFFGSIFGASSSLQAVNDKQYNASPWYSPISYAEGSRTIVTSYESGDSTKPISVYAVGGENNLITSSYVGLKFNIFSFTLDITLGLNNTGISGYVTKDNEKNGLVLRADITQLQVVLEGFHTTDLGNGVSETIYKNAGLNAMLAAATACIIMFGTSSDVAQFATM